MRGKIRPGMQYLTGRRGEIRITVRLGRRNLTGRCCRMRGNYVPVLINLTALQSAACDPEQAGGEKEIGLP